MVVDSVAMKGTKMLVMDTTKDRFILCSICACVCCLNVGFPGPSRFSGTTGLPESVWDKHSVEEASSPPLPASLYFTRLICREHLVFNISIAFTCGGSCSRLVKVAKVRLSLMLMKMVMLVVGVVMVEVV